MINLITAVLLLELVQALSMHNKILNIEKQIMGESAFRQLTDFLTDAKMYQFYRRSMNPSRLAKARELYKTLTKHMPAEELKKILRETPAQVTDPPTSHVHEEHARLVEKELKTALTHKKSALFDRPYVEKKGRNDFLVMRPDRIDPFVTVIPNAIYYSVEKKCVNWLDDCSLQGIRARLLQGVQSPYK